MKPASDDRDYEIKSIRERELNARRNRENRPMLGDYLRFPDGTLARFTHDWDDSLQTTVYRKDHPCLGDSSFYLGNEGCVSFSGSRAPSIPLEKINPTNDWIDASFWFFHNNFATAHNGVTCTFPVKVWDLLD